MQLTPPRNLFIGLFPNRELQLRIQRHASAWTWPPQARLIRFGRYHLSLHAVGEQVGLAPENRLRAAMREVAMEPLELVLATPMAWKHGLAVLRPAPHPGLDRLHERIADHLPHARARFTPHVTLAWEAQGAVPPSAACELRWTVNEFVLVWSRMDTRPAQHVVLERFGVKQGAVAPPRRAAAQGDLFGAG